MSTQFYNLRPPLTRVSIEPVPDTPLTLIHLYTGEKTGEKLFAAITTANPDFFMPAMCAREPSLQRFSYGIHQFSTPTAQVISEYNELINTSTLI